ncbi:MAG: inositol monophosphatase family protein [Patescibacteria group bacterium]|jgi:myo-inositol-1(or 4)-monophosphatase
MATNLQTRLQVAKQAAFIAGDELARRFALWESGGPAIDAAAAEVAARETILIFLKQIYPNEVIWGRNCGELGSATSFWLIDGLNGEGNFSTRNDKYGTSVTWVENGEPTVAAVSMPERRHLFWATKGAGAFYQDRKMHARTEANLTEAFVYGGFGPIEAREQAISAAVKLAKVVRQLSYRDVPALNFMAVAHGIHDVFVGHHLKPWDWVGPKLIVEEAGGTVTDWQGQPMKLATSTAVASNGRLHNDILKLLGA